MGESVLLSFTQNLTHNFDTSSRHCLILTHQCLGEFKKLIFFSLFFLPFAYYYPTFSNCHQLCTGTTSHLKYKFHSMTCRTMLAKYLMPRFWVPILPLQFDAYYVMCNCNLQSPLHGNKIYVPCIWYFYLLVSMYYSKENNFFYPYIFMKKLFSKTVFFLKILIVCFYSFRQKRRGLLSYSWSKSDCI